MDNTRRLNFIMAGAYLTALVASASVLKNDAARWMKGDALQDFLQGGRYSTCLANHTLPLSCSMALSHVCNVENQLRNHDYAATCLRLRREHANRQHLSDAAGTAAVPAADYAQLYWENLHRAPQPLPLQAERM